MGPARPGDIPSPDSHDLRAGLRGCASVLLLLGGVVVAGCLLAGLVLLNTPFTGDVGPGPGFFGFFFLLGAGILGLLLTGFWIAYFRPRTPGRWIGAALVGLSIAAAVGTWAPWAPPRTYPAPEIAGVIASDVDEGYGVRHVVLKDGRALELRTFFQGGPTRVESGQYLFLGGRSIEVGDLLLAGSQPSPWFAGAPIAYSGFYAGAPNGCYFLDGSGTARDGSVEFDLGLRVATASNFEVQSPRRDIQGACLDANGLVIALWP